MTDDRDKAVRKCGDADVTAGREGVPGALCSCALGVCLDVGGVPWLASYVNVETGNYVTDVAKIRAMTGWSPRTAFADGVRQTVACYREHGPLHMDS